MIKILHVVAIASLIGSAGYAYSVKYDTIFHAEELARINNAGSTGSAMLSRSCARNGRCSTARTGFRPWRTRICPTSCRWMRRASRSSPICPSARRRTTRSAGSSRRSGLPRPPRRPEPQAGAHRRDPFDPHSDEVMHRVLRSKEGPKTPRRPACNERRSLGLLVRGVLGAMRELFRLRGDKGAGASASRRSLHDPLRRHRGVA
jgi:hypothetical protein